MASIIEHSKEIPVLHQCDVVVVGGGPSGMAAAACAAKAGAKTLLIERYGCLGGNITISAVGPVSWYRQAGTTTPGGVAAELEQRMIALDAVSQTSFRPSTGYCYDTEMFKYMADQYILEQGITPLYHCTGTTAYLEDGVVKGVITESKSGRVAVLASRVIDCTGDADIAARAGAPYEQGNVATGQCGAATLKFFLTGVNVEKLEAAMDEDPENRDPLKHKLFHKTFDKAAAAGEPPFAHSLNLMQYDIVSPTDINVNLATFDKRLDATNVESLTEIEIAHRKLILAIIDRLNKYGVDEGFGAAKLRNYAMAVGVRESRRIVADYILTAADILEGRRFADTVGVFPIYMDGEGVKRIPYTSEYFQVPFRILVPTQLQNLLCAGRCVSCTRDAVPTTRQMDFCMLTGQAAGAASALSIRQGVPSAKVEITALQAELERQGVRIF